MAKIKVLEQDITTIKFNDGDYISLTDIANSKDGELRAADVIKNWIRNRGTLEFIGTWEQMYNSNFKVVEFDHFKMSAGLPSFVLSPGKWIEKRVEKHQKVREQIMKIKFDPNLEYQQEAIKFAMDIFRGQNI